MSSPPQPPLAAEPIKNPIQMCHDLAREKNWDEIKRLHLGHGMPLTWFVVSYAIHNSPDHPDFIPWAIERGAPVTEDIFSLIKVLYPARIVELAEKQLCKRPWNEEDKTPSSSGPLDDDPVD